MTWRTFMWHMIAYIAASFSVGCIIVAAASIQDIATASDTLAKPGGISFMMGMAIMMWLFHLLLAGGFVLAGVLAGWHFQARQWWFTAAWGVFTVVAVNYFFKNQTMNATYWTAVAVAGFVAGIIYWRIAIRRADTNTSAA